LMPVTASLFTAGIIALIGLPPFGFFISELSLFRAGFAAKHYLLMGVVLVLVAVAFVAMLNQLNKMLYGEPPDGTSLGEEDSWWWFTPMLVPLIVLIVLGLSIPAPFAALLQQAVRIITNE
jgi:hydrogenase-4 component F